MKDYLKSDLKLQFFPDSAFNVSLDETKVDKSLKDINTYGDYICFSRSMIRENRSAIGYLIKTLVDQGFKIIFLLKMIRINLLNNMPMGIIQYS